MRNPQTVEARIWDLLNEKLERIQLALSSVIEEQEDTSQLVIGMTGNSVFNELFSGAQGLSNERLSAWFDEATATLGGRDVVETPRSTPTQKTPKTILSAFGRCPQLVAARQLGSPLTPTLTTQSTMRSASPTV